MNTYKVILDMGCGKAYIANHFKDHPTCNFKFYNYDLFQSNDTVTVCDIKKLPILDSHVNICIMCLSLWGPDFRDYIKEAYRVLETRGILIIVEPTKRWLDEDNNNMLEDILEKQNFQIENKQKNQTEKMDKYSMTIAVKKSNFFKN
jgi:ubiquinone/menaquinone biosynthesis C-methylase UbiE